jgi:chromosome segregation ATPase
MDKYIEMFAPLLIDWQQTAIANTRYSVVLAALAFIIGCQLVALWKRKSIANLNQQLLEEKQALEQIEHKLKQTEHQHEELLVKHKSDVESITQLQQQLEQVSTNLQESEERYAEILPKHEQLTKVLDEKQSAMDALKSDLDDKTHVVESIQGKLAEQKELLAQYALDKTQIEEMKKEASEASSVKQQLQQREGECREHIKKIEKLEQSVKSSIDRVLELESQLQKRSHTDKSEATLEQVMNTIGVYFLKKR